MSKPKVVNTSSKRMSTAGDSYHVAYFRPIKKNDLIKDIGLDPDNYYTHEYYSVVRSLKGETEIKFGATIMTKSLFGYEYNLVDKAVTKDVTNDTEEDLSKLADKYYDEMKAFLLMELKKTNKINEIIVKQDVKEYIKENE